MRKSKIMKALLVFGMSVVTATAMVGITACDNGDGGDDSGKTTHKHVWSDWEPVDGDATKHQHECTADGHEGDKIVTAPHGNADQNGQCPDCHYQLVPQGENPPATEDVVINIASVYTANGGSGSTITLGNGIALGEGVSIYLKDGKDPLNSASSGGRKPLVAGEEVSTATHRLQLTSKSNGGIKVALEKDATVLVYANSNGSDVRKLALYADENLSGEAAQEQGIGVNGNDLDTAVFDVKGGETCYIGASNTVNIFYIVVAYNTINETPEKVEAKPASCTEGGNIEYYKTNYGRYYVLSGETKTYKSIQEIHAADTSKLDHKYTYEASDITVTPTADTVGSVTLHCENNHTTVVELPILSSEDYTQTPIEGSDNATYTYKAIEGLATNVSFTAATTKQKEYVWNTVYSNLFAADSETAVGIRASATTLTEGVKVNGWTNNSTEVTAWDSDYNVAYSGNKLTVTDKGSKSANAYITFDTAITSGVYKISGTLSLYSAKKTDGSDNSNVAAGKWSPIHLVSDMTYSDNDSFAALRTDKDKKVGLVSGMTGDAVLGTGWAYTASDAFTFEFTVDMDAKKVTLIVTDKTDAVVYKHEDLDVSAKATQWKGIRIQTGDSAFRTVEVSNLTVTQKVEKPAE